MEQVSLALRDQICRLGVSPEVTASVLGAFDACRGGARRRAQITSLRYRPTSGASVAATSLDETVALRDVPVSVASFCHDVLLYRAFIGPAYLDSARDWLGPCLWHIVCALGGWRRVHTLPLRRMVDEAMTAHAQAPSFLRPPAYRLMALNMEELWKLTRPWARKYASLATMAMTEMAKKSLTAGAWLWVMDRTDADVRRRGAGPDRDLPKRVLRLAERVDAAVGLEWERA